VAIDWEENGPRSRLVQAHSIKPRQPKKPGTGLKMAVSYSIFLVLLLSVLIFLSSLVSFGRVALG
ncbi:MAG: hypothetical protein ACKO0V_09880, partial [bacterium]